MIYDVNSPLFRSLLIKKGGASDKRGKEWQLKRCRAADRLTSLPFDLLSRILSLLPTKDVAATKVLCKRMRHALSWITSVDLDESPISHCPKHPHLIECFPLFMSFIDNVLLEISLPLTRFRLRLGREISSQCFHYYYAGGLQRVHRCEKACLPDLEATRLNVWISYPLAHCGLRELDLSFHLRNPSDFKLPASLFACQSLEVLRLDSNIEIDDGAKIPLMCLPNLKLLHLESFVFTEDDFVTRLVSSCPALEDLTVTSCLWQKSDRLIISSYSLRKLVLNIGKYVEDKSSDLVLIDTPNLLYLKYRDNLSYHYSLAHLNALVEAHIYIDWVEPFDQLETFEIQLSLTRALSNVQRLSLTGHSAENYFFAGELKDQLPVFHNLTTLDLGAITWGRWDIVLLLILHCSPLLESLFFSEGLFLGPEMHEAALEAEGWRTTPTIPSCFRTHLKQIVFGHCFGLDRELNTIKFLLEKSLVLKELTVQCLSKAFTASPLVPSLDIFERMLEELPRASNACSIKVQR